MENQFFSELKRLKWGVLFATLTILYGFGMGGFFGANEKAIKTHLADEGKAALEVQYKGDEAAMNKVVSKSWSYFKRSHLHGGAIGAASLALILLLGAMYRKPLLRTVTSIALGFGGLGYSVFWMLAGLTAPGIGGTGAAKDSLEWLAVPTASMLLLGIISVVVLVVTELFLTSSVVEEKLEEVEA
ncbi:hypothetical protein [Sediminitomix flava]|uniref:Uncharacterized protein n=1 Tax=Sediminitomix flava TaxID=379075 RepID=A0A315Z7B6_SEDFL|nr:hypothetical protein [Sediminitomix flava]PWJ40034.1 hypothetical protein BC781_10597 [Sediminitomix flava]